MGYCAVDEGVVTWKPEIERWRAFPNLKFKLGFAREGFAIDFGVWCVDHVKTMQYLLR
jgi:hypothetical protein